MQCRVRDDGWTEPETVRIAVRSTADGEVVFEASSDQLGAAIPVSGAFTVQFELQMNVQRGIYLIECHAWDRMMGRVSFTGPAANVDVRDGIPFTGIAQLNARAAIVPGVSTTGTSMPNTP